MMKINVRVTPNAKKDKIVRNGDNFKVYIHAPAEGGRANAAAVELIADFLNVKKNRIRIVRGARSRNKIIEIDAPSPI